ncbi:MAG: right-handed parallel beta-helix repeat-containing protein [Spirochaetaceae bacterium]|nr:right-handed parallel beta-helix repeat-containing protein [Spirochaetaceae bacterium]
MEAQQVIRVKSVAEFIRAIGPRRVIQLAPGVYDLSKGAATRTKNVTWDRSSGDPEPVIEGVEDLTIDAAGAELVASSPYARVLAFKDSSLVTLRGARLLHRVSEPCMAGVLALAGCSDFRIEECELLGSGAVGIEIEASSGISLSGGAIRDCSVGAVWARDSWGLSFANLAVEGNGGGSPLIAVAGVTGMIFGDCRFSDNSGAEFLSFGPGTEDFGFEYCEFSGNDFEALTTSEALPYFFEAYYEGNSFDGELDALVEYGGDGAAGFFPHEVAGSGLALSYPEWFSLDESDPAAPVLAEGDPAVGAILVGKVYVLKRTEDPDTQAERIFRAAAPLAEKWLSEKGIRVASRLHEEPVNTEAPPYHFEYYAKAMSGGKETRLRVKLIQGDGAVWCFAAYHPDEELLTPGAVYGVVLDGVERAGAPPH